MFAVIFEVQPRAEAWEAYLGHAAMLRPELLCIDGFLDNERFASRGRPGWLVSLSLWRNEKALVRWRTQARHHLAQGQGRDTVFADYRLRVGEVTLDTAATEPLPQLRFDETEAGPAKAVSLTDGAADALAPLPGALDSDLFDSITRPGIGLLLHAWPTPADAIVPPNGRTRVVRVIRDYGLHRREEAPQYFPPAQPA
ncbi:MAG: antibiotic biosynthesis monooxygenase [Acetobacteraceae bacterium]|nr:antibiotic biosynthesis monooxygenase [Pseudomonadota bacterium]